MDDFDAFIAQAVALKKNKPKRTRKVRTVEPGPEFTRTKEYLRELAIENATPVEVVLHMTDQECECGEHMTSVNNTPLVKCEGSNFTHYKQVTSFADMQQYDHLPRVIERRKVYVPYCETCFANATNRHLPAEDPVWADLMEMTRSDG